jgi:hypothetical protein
LKNLNNPLISPLLIILFGEKKAGTSSGTFFTCAAMTDEGV